MPDKTQPPMSSETSLDDLLAQYIAGEEAGSALDRQELLQQHPEHADDLREFFANRDQMQRVAAPLRGASDESSPSGRANGHPLDEIAVGGMGIVYKARRVSFSRIVA